MTREGWAEVERLLHEAKQLAPTDREAFVANIQPAEVRAEVASLLAVAVFGTTAMHAMVGEAAAAVLDELLVKGTLGHFEVIRSLGHGAMGEVYLAQDVRLGRLVALKVLPTAFQGDTERVRRFQREARAAAALNHPNIVTVHEVGEWQGRSFIATEFVEGETLAERVRRGPFPVMDAARVGGLIADALAAAHEAGVIHRDLKPANVMLRPDGGVKVLDFGLARLVRPLSDSGPADATETQTVVGTILGTISYMSPEQARGEAADARSDLWSLGVVLYEMLAARRPFDGGSQPEILSGILARDPVPLRSLNRGVPSGLERLISRLLAKNREQRPPSSAGVARELKRFSSVAFNPIARTRRRRLTAAAVLVLLALVGAAGWSLSLWSKRQWARHEAIPLARTLTDQGDYAGAYRLALEATRYIPEEPSLLSLWPDVSQLVSVRSEPSGADVTWKPYGQPSAPWQPLGQTPLRDARLPAGPLRIQVTSAGYDPVQTAVDRVTSMGELARSDLEVALERAGAATRMVRLKEQTANATAFGRRRAMPAFEVDRFEVTNREFKEFINRGGYQSRQYWNVPFVDQGRTLSWEQAIARFVDPTGRPGPSTWEAGTYSPGQDDYPVSGVSWYEAVAYAEFAGKSLPTVAHWLRASNLDVVATDYRFLIPLSNLQNSHALPVGASSAVNSWGLYDVAGNVREWCWNESGGRRAILGGSWADQARDARAVDNAGAFDRSAINGFRLARYADARRALEDFGGSVSPATRPDYTKVKPVSNEVFEVYKVLYAYDKKPLDPVVESVDESSELWRREKIRFQAPYGNEQEIVYLFLPKDGKPPYQCIVYMGDGATLRPGSGDTIQPDHAVLRSGRAMIYPIYKATLDRYVQTAGDPVARRDLAIAWRKDLSSAIDYLQTRPDIDAAKLAYMGHSMGTRFSPTILATESRLQAAVLLAGGLEAPGALPEADPVNFLPRVRLPVLLVAGLYDPAYPVESAQKPMIALLGTPPKDKRHVILPVGHAILVPEVRATVVREVLDWLDRYLGRP